MGPPATIRGIVRGGNGAGVGPGAGGGGCGGASPGAGMAKLGTGRRAAPGIGGGGMMGIRAGGGLVGGSSRTGRRLEVRWDVFEDMLPSGTTLLSFKPTAKTVEM